MCSIILLLIHRFQPGPGGRWLYCGNTHEPVELHSAGQDISTEFICCPNLSTMPIFRIPLSECHITGNSNSFPLDVRKGSESTAATWGSQCLPWRNLPPQQDIN